MTLQKVLSRVRQAVDDYHMIEEGDRIAVGISGGKDSLTLLLALYELSKFYPKHFTLIAVTVDLGFLNLIISIVGFVLAFRCFKEEEIYKTTPTFGVVINGFVLVSYVALYILGVL